ncbi:DegT/DnrJ/EryC1/StrS family aminotransferase [Metabacillus iocasae]|uniref:dTDP-4-amino-4,6-dideoxygalactose transaminase n=1 Tax=Priestia iocasae TaxID=2291674 RepID=A0ABS2QYC0_9BACI|nr:DegT/DnrJ/EryC1/StrS family aminotransferase [Metabacillus iocasae]MBM7704475.1 dTDP-4-amino-4,6-dideoxygalactose transaminase [Metabacillus iocasae]
MVKRFREPIYVTRPVLPDIDSVNDAIGKVWVSKWLTNGGLQHKELEKQLQNYLNVDHISLFNNGTLALVLGIKALELTGEVITTPFTFPATVQALDWNHLNPVFCDINPKTLNIDADKIEALITDKTSAILGVHVFGNPCEVGKIQQIADKYNLKVIYDGAHAFGTKIKGKPIGSFGDMTMFSFHATKLFNTVEGGALTFHDEEIGEKLALLKNFGLVSSESVVLSGLNAKMNEVQAAIGLEVLKLVDQERVRRDKVRETYEKNLADIPGIRIITGLKNKSSSYQYFVIEIDASKYGRTRDWIHKELEKYNVYTRRYFYPLCSDFHWYKHLDSAQPENLPQAQKSVQQVLSLPYYGDLELESVEGICRILREMHTSAPFLIPIKD